MSFFFGPLLRRFLFVYRHPPTHCAWLKLCHSRLWYLNIWHNHQAPVHSQTSSSFFFFFFPGHNVISTTCQKHFINTILCRTYQKGLYTSVWVLWLMTAHQRQSFAHKGKIYENRRIRTINFYSSVLNSHTGSGADSSPKRRCMILLH